MRNKTIASVVGFLLLSIQSMTLAQWVQVNTGLGNRTIGALLSSDDTLYAGSEAGVYRSTNFGNNWSLISSGLPSFTEFLCIVRSGSSLVAGGNHFGVWRSSDLGVSWTRILNGVDSSDYVHALTTDGSTVYASIGFPASVGISTDNGATWTKSTNGLSTSATFTGVARLGSTLFAMHEILGPYFSTDNGGSWTLLAGVIFAQDKNALMESGGSLCAATNTGIFRSTNAGATWTHVLTSDIITGFSTSGATLYAVGRSQYKSTDSGQSWILLDNSGLPGSVPGTLQIAGGFAFVNMGGVGIYRRETSQLTGVSTLSDPRPSQVDLEQNYPNPFNPSTTIAFTIPQTSFTTLRVYDILGREVATLVNEVRPGGRHTERFDATGLASGTYVYRLTTSSHAMARKLLLMR